MRKLNILRQESGISFVKNIVIEMGEKCAFWFDALDVFEGFVEAEVRVVRFDPNAVEHENIEPLQSRDRFLGNKIQVGRVGKIVKAISDHRQFAVDNLERSDLDIFADAKRRIRQNSVRYQLRQAAAKMRWLENILENSPKIGPRDLVRINTHRSVTKIERPYIIKPKNVINVAMRYENSIKMADLRTQSLLAKVYRRINEYLLFAVLDQYRNPQPLITRIVGQARFTVAPDRGNAGRCACTEKSEFHKGNCHRDHRVH
jgi:hypothetical protein